jgi:hypothetical protein
MPDKSTAGTNARPAVVIPTKTKVKPNGHLPDTFAPEPRVKPAKNILEDVAYRNELVYALAYDSRVAAQIAPNLHADDFKPIQGTTIGDHDARARWIVAEQALAYFQAHKKEWLQSYRQSRAGARFLEEATSLVIEGKYSAESVERLLHKHQAFSPAETIKSTSPQWPEPMKSEAYHGLTGEVVQLIEPYTEADPAALLIHFLVLFGNLVGRSGRFMIGAAAQYTNLFAAIIGPTSGGRKGTAYTEVINVLSHVDRDWSRDRQLKGLASPEALIYYVRDDKLNAEGDVAEEGVSDKRILVTEPEFSRLLNLCKQPLSKMSPLIRDSYDTGNLANLRTGGNQVTATGAHVSIIAHITPEELKRDLSSTEMLNGFANRFLWVCSRRPKLISNLKPVPEDQIEDLARRIAGAAKYARGAQKRTRTKEALELWEHVYLNQLNTEHPGLFGAATARASTQVIRLALIYALLDREKVIKRVHLQAALAVWQYCHDSAQFLFGDALGDPAADDLLKELRGRPQGRMTRNDVYLYFHKHKSNEAIGGILEVLRANGRIRITEEKEGAHRPTTWIEIVGPRLSNNA